VIGRTGGTGPGGEVTAMSVTAMSVTAMSVTAMSVPASSSTTVAPPLGPGVAWSTVSGHADWERRLVARLEAGDESAMATVYDQYAPLVHGIAARLVGATAAPDVCQDVFVALWDHPERWDPERGSLRTFLAMIARRRCIDLLRRDGRRAANECRAHRAEPVVVPNVDEAAWAMMAGERVRRALAALPSLQRRAIELAYFDGLTFREVAIATGASEGTAKSRIRLGLQHLREAIGVGEVATP
jgi:RNA polymerase sigma-70 factor (ECF subfamily)